MNRITDIELETSCKKFETALARFMKKYPGHEEWKGMYQWMYETGTEFYCDNKLSDGRENPNWGYALHLNIYEEGYFYLALIERA